MKLEEMTLDVEQHVEVKADIGDVFKGVLHRFGEGSTNPNGESMQMILEQWPGGRWFRDRGNGIGHLWGHVQVIKPPALLEICGPLPMSYPVANHLQYRLTSEGNRTRLKFTHRGFGLIPQEHRDGMPEGWGMMLKNIRERAEAKKSKR